MHRIIFTGLVLAGMIATGAAGAYVWQHSNAPHIHGQHGEIIPQHSGGLDANGCHYDHTNGGYHCHR